MITVVCSILITAYAADMKVGVISRADVTGKVLGQSDTKYLVDFSKGVKKFHIANQPSDYDQVIVDKSDCVEEK
jgi:hypothetical protein